MNKLTSAILSSLFLSGCAMFDSPDMVNHDSDAEKQSPQIVKPTLLQGSLIAGIDNESNASKRLSSAGLWNSSSSFKQVNKKNVNHYARGIMQNLLSNLQYVNAATPVAVADFVYLDSNYESSTLLGRQLAEAFSHEVHKLGIPVVDYKLTDYIRVTAEGSFALSKDYLELSGEIPIRYILTGTLVDQGEVTIVNARMVGVQSKAIVGSAQGVIPTSVMGELHPKRYNDGLGR